MREQVHYLFHVMRLKLSNIIEVFNNKDGTWYGEIIFISNKEIRLRLNKCIKSQEKSCKLSLFFSPIKNPNTSYIVQKATELGVSDIYPIITDRSVVRSVNIEKLKANIIEAVEQCGGNNITMIHKPHKLRDILQSKFFQGNLLFCDETKKGQPIDRIKCALRDNAIIIGPEGGFTDDERKLLLQSDQTIAVSLGNKILRADTAIVAAISVYQAFHGNWYS